jgi:hypothetical protein
MMKVAPPAVYVVRASSYSKAKSQKAAPPESASPFAARCSQLK